MKAVNPLARARGHGSAKHGVHHWWLQRASSLLLIVLTGWLLYAMITLNGSSHEEAMAFMATPCNAAMAILLAIGGLYHAMLGMQVVIEDYIHSPAMEIFLQLAVKAATYAGMAISVIYILRMAIA